MATQSPKRPGAGATKEDPGLGYPTIEKLLETEKFEPINKSFASCYQALEKLSLERGAGIKKQKSAQKAMKSYELTTELLNELLKIKYQIVKMREEGAKKTQKK